MHMWFKPDLFIRRHHKLNKQVQETQKAINYAYLNVTYRRNDNYIYIYDGETGNYCQKSVNKTKQKPRTQQNGSGGGWGWVGGCVNKNVPVHVCTLT